MNRCATIYPEMDRREKAKNHPSWNGGRNFDSQGYIRIYMPEHPNALSGKYIHEHRLVMETKLGRRLNKNEHVHHINGIKADNRIENLELLTASDHCKEHRPSKFIEKHIPKESILKLYNKKIPLTVIAKKLKISRTDLYNKMDKYEIPKRGFRKIVDGKTTCAMCKELKSIDSFYKCKQGGLKLTIYCKPCYQKNNRRY